MAALEGERVGGRCEQARKRKERRDSGCSHERKERRAVSEERVQLPPPPPLHDSNRLEVERRAERLSRARRPQVGKRRRPIPRPIVIEPRSSNSVKENAFEQDHRSPSPVNRLDLDSLHRQLGRSEPARSWGCMDDLQTHRLDMQPRPVSPNTMVLKSPKKREALSMYLEPVKRLEKIKKKISSLKKSIAKYEIEYEESHGCSMLQTDKLTDIGFMKLNDELNKLKHEKKFIKTDPAEYVIRLMEAKKQKEQDDKLEAAIKSDKPMEELVADIEEWLAWCRSSGRWPQLSAEKAGVQRVLLRLEAARGRPPAHSAARAAARPLYDAYRSVKRALADACAGSTPCELTTILENEPMNCPIIIDSSFEDKNTTSEETEKSPLKQEIEEQTSTTSSAKSSSDETSNELKQLQSNESLHCFTIDQLTKVLIESKLQKNILRKSIKDFELGFEMRIEKLDRKSFEEDYEKYKAVKARIRLVTALINKKKCLSP